MLIIAGSEIRPDAFASKHPLAEKERKMLETMSAATRSSQFDSEEELLFELGMRKNIVSASAKLYRSRMRFKTFRESECNTDFWTRSEEGGFSLNEGVRPSDAILDIFRGGRKYGTECASALVIVFYKALLDIYQPELFDRTCRGIYLMNWQNARHLDITTYRNPEEYFPGDCRYFANPDVDPLTPEWQGENTIDLGDGQYYGHGIGITNADEIIAVLNENRISRSQNPAHLLESATRPDFKNLYSATVQ